MKIIGLCGGSGSGKGCVCDILMQYGFAIFDTDKIYHELLASDGALAFELVSAFGDGILTNGNIDRKKLGAIVFSDKSGEKLRTLNGISHKHILNAVRRGISEADKLGKSVSVVDAPVLFESGFDKECDFTVAVVSDKEKRISRIVLRDSISRCEAERRINSQIDDERLTSLCDYTIFNNGDLCDLKCEVSRIVDEII